MSSTGTLVISHLRLSTGGCWFRQDTAIPHKSGRSCQFMSFTVVSSTATQKKTAASKGQAWRLNRRSLCSACVGRAVRCVWRGYTPQRPEHDYCFALTAAKENNTQSTRFACCSSQQSTRRCHRCCICTLPTLHRMTWPAFAATSR